MKTSLIAQGLLRLFLSIAVFLSLNTTSKAQCKNEMGYAQFALETMELKSEQPDPKYNPRKCNITVHIKGSITNISSQTIWYLNFGTDGRPSQGIGSGLSNLEPGKTYNFDLSFTYDWINCGSVTELRVLENAADIKRGTMVCEFHSQTLPVELVTFDFDQSSRALVWKTASEINNQGFVIEHSEDGTTWTEIGFQEAAGSEGSGSDYSFTLQANRIDGYYRLVQMDWDGTTEYSSVVFIDQGSRDFGDETTLYPNPAQDFIYTNNPEVTRMDLYDLNSRFIRTIQMENRRTEIQDLRPGLYIAHLHAGNTVNQVKFIKG